MSAKTIEIDGMSCQHCVMAVKKSLEAIDGVTEADVEVGKASVTFDESKVKDSDLNDAIVQTGFKVK
ncbi:hypothetical protein LCGC14_1241120 [marine sediment metagenome]|uniref:HMA domain-containing protein n=1 Tax=marine sediment metagenome TaxID=412755 RepID=A0A0F9LSZ7_9ZZZZ